MRSRTAISIPQQNYTFRLHPDRHDSVLAIKVYVHRTEPTPLHRLDFPPVCLRVIGSMAASLLSDSLRHST